MEYKKLGPFWIISVSSFSWLGQLFGSQLGPQVRILKWFLVGSSRSFINPQNKSGPFFLLHVHDCKLRKLRNFNANSLWDNGPTASKVDINESGEFDEEERWWWQKLNLLCNLISFFMNISDFGFFANKTTAVTDWACWAQAPMPNYVIWLLSICPNTWLANKRRKSLNK